MISSFNFIFFIRKQLSWFFKIQYLLEDLGLRVSKCFMTVSTLKRSNHFIATHCFLSKNPMDFASVI